MKQQTLIELPTITLLEKFGSGKHAPGSGSAAALMGLLSSKLILTVATLSLKKAAYRSNHSKIEFIAEPVRNTIEPQLRALFERDANVFDEVIKLRVARDQETEERAKRRASELALERLQEATEIPLDICRNCLSLIDHGALMFDIGFKGARGDTGAAISAAVAGAMAAIFVTNLNLKSFRGSDWARRTRDECEDLHKSLESKQLNAFGRVATLRAEVVEAMNFGFPEIKAG